MNEDNATSLGALLQRLRTDAGISLYALAERTGINRSTLMRIEAGTTTQPDVQTLNALARALGVEAELFYDAVWETSEGPLPSAATYFRSKYQLSDAQIAEVTRTLDRMAKNPAPKPTAGRRTSKQPNDERRSP
jgi:transcriptional regulator with XRE-family HTH domain